MTLNAATTAAAAAAAAIAIAPLLLLQGFSAEETMVLGSAGVTAMMCVLHLEQVGHPWYMSRVVVCGLTHTAT